MREGEPRSTASLRPAQRAPAPHGTPGAQPFSSPLEIVLGGACLEECAVFKLLEDNDAPSLLFGPSLVQQAPAWRAARGHRAFAVSWCSGEWDSSGDHPAGDGPLEEKNPTGWIAKTVKLSFGKQQAVPVQSKPDVVLCLGLSPSLSWLCPLPSPGLRQFPPTTAKAAARKQLCQQLNVFHS